MELNKILIESVVEHYVQNTVNLWEVYRDKINEYKQEGWDIYTDVKKNVYIENKNNLNNYVITDKDMNFLLEKFKNNSKKFFLSDIDKYDYVMMAVLDEVKLESKKSIKEWAEEENKRPLFKNGNCSTACPFLREYSLTYGWCCILNGPHPNRLTDSTKIDPIRSTACYLWESEHPILKPKNVLQKNDDSYNAPYFFERKGIKNEQKKNIKENRELMPGDKATVAINSGVDSEKEVTIANWTDVKFDGRGIPINVQGAYQSPNRAIELPVRYQDGTIGIIDKDRLIPFGEKPNIRFKGAKRRLSGREITDIIIRFIELDRTLHFRKRWENTNNRFIIFYDDAENRTRSISVSNMGIEQNAKRIPGLEEELNRYNISWQKE